MPAHEFVFGRNQVDEIVVRELRQINPSGLLIVVDDFVDPAVAPIVAIHTIVMALIRVVPIDDIHRSILIVRLV